MDTQAELDEAREAELYAALVKAREFVRCFTAREDHLGDRAKDVAIVIDHVLAKARANDQ